MRRRLEQGFARGPGEARGAKAPGRPVRVALLDLRREAPGPSRGSARLGKPSNALLISILRLCLDGDIGELRAVGFFVYRDASFFHRRKKKKTGGHLHHSAARLFLCFHHRCIGIPHHDWPMARIQIRRKWQNG